MAQSPSSLHAINSDRNLALADRVLIADSHFARLVGLLAIPASAFQPGNALWIRPSRGVHTLGMRYPIDAVYLDANLLVVHLEADLQPWRMGRMVARSRSVLELPAGTIARTKTQLGDQVTIGSTR